MSVEAVSETVGVYVESSRVMLWSSTCFSQRVIEISGQASHQSQVQQAGPRCPASRHASVHNAVTRAQLDFDSVTGKIPVVLSDIIFIRCTIHKFPVILFEPHKISCKSTLSCLYIEIDRMSEFVSAYSISGLLAARK